MAQSKLGTPTQTSRRSFLGAGSYGALLVSAASGIQSRRPVLATPQGLDDDAWEDVRAQFLLEPGVAYLNNASLGMPPVQVVEAVARGYRALSREPLHGKYELNDTIQQRVLPKLARTLGADPEELALTRNATEALHLQTVGLQLQPGDEVLYTSQEHPAGRRPWEFRTRYHGITARPIFVPSPLPSEDEVVEILEGAIGDKTRAIAFCHVTRGGHLYPVKRLSSMARSRGVISLVDGAQAVGMFPINLRGLGCDAYSASLHKWLLGPVGTGVLFVRTEARAQIRSSYAPDATLASPALAPPGTVDLPLRAALEAALDFSATIGLENIERRTRYLSDYLKQRLVEMKELTLLSGETNQVSGPASTIFEMKGVDPLALVPLFDREHSMHIDEHQRDGHNAIRISTHVYNTTRELDRLISALVGLRG